MEQIVERLPSFPEGNYKAEMKAEMPARKEVECARSCRFLGTFANLIYRHGGLSLMEMLVPWIVLERV